MTSLTDSQRQQLRAALERRKEELLAELAEIQRGHLRHAAEPDEREVDDPEEQAERLAGEAVSDAEARRDHDELVGVRAALERFADGSYGECVHCGKAIGVPRLLVHPAAARCIDCQSRAEKHLLG